MSHTIYLWQNAIRARLHHALRRCLSQGSRSTLKVWRGKARKRVSWALPLLYGHYNAREIVKELSLRIPKDFEILMVHSAYERLLPMYSGTPQELVNELLAFCGMSRTLVMPTFVLGGRFYDKVAYFKNRAFDVSRTPSEMGVLSEVCRRMPEAVRSLHPTHSICAIGPLAHELTATHHLVSTRAGKGTPFETMVQRRTAIVGLGVEYFRCLAHTHTAEDMMGDDFPIKFKRVPIPVVIIDSKKNRLNYSLTIPQASAPLDNFVVRSLLSRDELVEWRFRGTEIFVTLGSVVTKRLIEAAKNGITVYGAS